MVTDLIGATLEEQRVFLEWLNAHRAVRVITLSEVPLFDFVGAGTLLEQLYYRLNPIYCALDWNCGSGSEQRAVTRETPIPGPHLRRQPEDADR